MTLRIPEDMHVAIRRLAEREDRPITDQIIRFLRQGLIEAGELDADGKLVERPRP